MANDPLISVIVPVFNTERYLERCVQSIVKQSYHNLEIILVDDGSPDTCPALCDLWATCDSRIRVIHEENKGLSAARNVGMRAATGEFITFVDSDDYLERDAYEAMMSLFWNTGCDIAVCGVMMFWEDEDRAERFTGSYSGVMSRENAVMAIVREDRLTSPVWNKIYRRELVEGIEFQNVEHREDIFWSFQVVARANLVAVTDFIGYNYLRRHGGIIGRGFSEKNLDELDAILARQQLLIEQYPELEVFGKTSITKSCIYFGRKALLYLWGDEKHRVMRRLKTVIRTYGPNREELKKMDFYDAFWFRLARHALRLTCWLRNSLKLNSPDHKAEKEK